MADDEDEVTEGTPSDPTFATSGPRRSTFTPPPASTAGSGDDVHDDDALAEALAAEFTRLGSGTINLPPLRVPEFPAPAESAVTGPAVAEPDAPEPIAPEPVAPAADLDDTAETPPWRLAPAPDPSQAVPLESPFDPPVRRSRPDDELLQWVDEAGREPGGTLNVIEELENQLRLREEEAKDFQAWESRMKSLGTPDAIAAVEEARPEFTGVLPPVPVPPAFPPPAPETFVDPEVLGAYPPPSRDAFVAPEERDAFVAPEETVAEWPAPAFADEPPSPEFAPDGAYGPPSDDEAPIQPESEPDAPALGDAEPEPFPEPEAMPEPAPLPSWDIPAPSASWAPGPEYDPDTESGFGPEAVPESAPEAEPAPEAELAPASRVFDIEPAPDAEPPLDSQSGFEPQREPGFEFEPATEPGLDTESGFAPPPGFEAEPDGFEPEPARDADADAGFAPEPEAEPVAEPAFDFRPPSDQPVWPLSDEPEHPEPTAAEPAVWSLDDEFPTEQAPVGEPPTDQPQFTEPQAEEPHVDQPQGAERSPFDDLFIPEEPQEPQRSALDELFAAEQPPAPERSPFDELFVTGEPSAPPVYGVDEDPNASPFPFDLGGSPFGAPAAPPPVAEELPGEVPPTPLVPEPAEELVEPSSDFGWTEPRAPEPDDQVVEAVIEPETGESEPFEPEPAQPEYAEPEPEPEPEPTAPSAFEPPALVEPPPFGGPPILPSQAAAMPPPAGVPIDAGDEAAPSVPPKAFSFEDLLGGDGADPVDLVRDEEPRAEPEPVASTPEAIFVEPLPPAPGEPFLTDTGTVTIIDQAYEDDLDDDVDETDRAFPTTGPVTVDPAGNAVIPGPIHPPSGPISTMRIPEDEVVLIDNEPTNPPVFSIEPSGVEPTPVDLRAGRAARLFWLWFAANSSVLSFALGAAVIAVGMNLRQSIVAILAGVALSFIPLGLTTLAGKRSGQPTMVISRATFGMLGNVLPATIALLGRVFWGAVLLWLLGSSVAIVLVGAELGGAFGDRALMLLSLGVAFVVAVVIAFAGYPLLARIQLVLSIVSGALVVGLIAMTIPYVDIPNALTRPDGPWLLTVSGAVLVFSFVGLVWANSGADLARYQRPGSSGASSMLWATFGAMVPAFLLIGYGALLAASDEGIASGFIGSPLDTLALMLPLWYPIPLIAATALSLLSGITIALYSGGFALQAMGIRVPRQVGVIIAAVLVGGLAVLFTFGVTGGIYELFRDAATTLAVPTAAWAGIFAAETMIRNRRFESESLVRRGGVYADVRWVNLVALVLISAIGFALTTATITWLSWQGYGFTLLGIPLDDQLAQTDLGVLAALVLGLLAPIILGIPAIRRQEATKL